MLLRSRTHTTLYSKPLILRTYAQTAKRLDAQQRPAVTKNYTRPPAPKSRATNSQLPVIPLVAIFCLGTLSFYWLVKSREGQGQSHYVLPDRAPPKEQWPRSNKDEK